MGELTPSSEHNMSSIHYEFEYIYRGWYRIMKKKLGCCESHYRIYKGRISSIVDEEKLYLS